MQLRLDHVRLFYEGASGGGIAALDDVSLSLGPGVTGVMGQTGSGKTTLLEVMAGVLPPDAGGMTFDGADALCGDGARGLRAAVGMVSQIPERQFFESTVGREMAFGLLARGMDADAARMRASEALSALGLSLDVLARRSPFSLSGGQQRRVAIASVLALRPKLLLLDEPTAGLDPRSRSACLDAVRTAGRSGAIVIVASHDANALAAVADRVVVLEKGRVTLDGSARGLLGNAPLMREHGLEPACAARAADALRRAGVAVPGEPLTSEELAMAIAAGRGLA